MIMIKTSSNTLLDGKRNKTESSIKSGARFWNQQNKKILRPTHRHSGTKVITQLNRSTESGKTKIKQHRNPRIKKSWVDQTNPFIYPELVLHAFGIERREGREERGTDVRFEWKFENSRGGSYFDILYMITMMDLRLLKGGAQEVTNRFAIERKSWEKRGRR